MRDNYFQIGGTGNSQKVINYHKQKNWQDNVMLYIFISVLVVVTSAAVVKYFGW